MTQDVMSLSDLEIDGDGLKIERNLLKDRAADVLREYISMGRIPEGTKLTEREVSQLLGISRMPVHDALMTLESEGLVTRRSGARYVIELNKKDVRDLLVTRRVLEMKAAEEAAKAICPRHCAELKAAIDRLDDAIAKGDFHLSAKCDMDIHRVIWRQANNRYLLESLRSLVGVSYVLNDRMRSYEIAHDQQPINDHRPVIACILKGDAEGAAAEMEKHLIKALAKGLRTFRMLEDDDVDTLS
jgi:DNA-binding GntR family transcriptional regulator